MPIVSTKYHVGLPESSVGSQTTQSALETAKLQAVQHARLHAYNSTSLPFESLMKITSWSVKGYTTRILYLLSIRFYFDLSCAKELPAALPLFPEFWTFFFIRIEHGFAFVQFHTSRLNTHFVWCVAFIPQQCYTLRSVQNSQRKVSSDIVSSISRLAIKWMDRTDFEIEDRKTFVHRFSFLRG
jgi:hypothetical protein